MSTEDARRLLERVGVLRHPCDLDLLLFFVRHPRSLITSEQLASWLGYELKQVADSLEILLNADVLTRTQNPTHAARMYVLHAGGSSGGWLPGVLSMASTRQGRLALLEVLSRRTSRPSDGRSSLQANENVSGTSRPRPVEVPRNRDRGPDTMAG